eukprot:scaffold64518_cov48-Phaeocystis_antarctica.AAC.1
MLFYNSALATRLDASTTGFAADTSHNTHALADAPHTSPHRTPSYGPQAASPHAGAPGETDDAAAVAATAAALAALTFADAHGADAASAAAAETLDLADYAPASPPLHAQRGSPDSDEAEAAGPATAAARERGLRPSSEVDPPAAALRPPRPPGSDAARGEAAASGVEGQALLRPPSPEHGCVEHGCAEQGGPSLAGALPLSMRNMLAGGAGGQAVQGAPSGLQPGSSHEYTVPQFTFEVLECCEQLGGARAYRLTADLKLCATTQGTGCKVASDMLTFRAKEVGYELMYKWPEPIDETRATKSFSKRDRALTVVAPLLRQ